MTESVPELSIPPPLPPEQIALLKPPPVELALKVESVTESVPELSIPPPLPPKPKWRNAPPPAAELPLKWNR